jgi:hypothetical protein
VTNSAQDAPPNTDPVSKLDALPISIHPNPDYYVETQSSPYLRVRKVIDISDGGVLGITGERGAGKSVLLNKLVDAYSKDFLTVNLSAPISSSREMEFFLMLFRHLTQRVISELKQRMKTSGDDIDAIGYDALRRQRWFYLLKLCALSVALMIGMWSVYGWQLNKAKIANVQEFLIATSATPTPLAAARPSPTATPLAAARPSPTFTPTPTSTTTPTSAASALTSPTPQGQKPRRFTQADLDRLEKETWPWLGELGQSGQLILWSSLLLVGVVLVSRFQPWKPKRSLPPLEMGLLIYSEQLSRKLDYELTAKGEWGAEITPLKWLKFSNKKATEEKARALSLPELTADYIEFVANVLRVFPGKLLICIDELDKVTDLDQVRFILREIKGALYAKGTFYMLSISNDALRSFEGRLGDQRDIFESTFDDVFSVRSLDLSSSMAVLTKRLTSFGAGEKVQSFSDNALVVISVFSAGNARDLIRGFRECAISISDSEISAAKAWSLLFARRAESILDRVVASKGVDDERSAMITLAEDLLEYHDPLTEQITRVKDLREKMVKLLVTPNMVSTDEKPTLERLTRYCTELEILLYAKERVADHSDPPLIGDPLHTDASMIMKAYQLLPFSHADSLRIIEALAQGRVDVPTSGRQLESIKSVLHTPVADRKSGKGEIA